MYISETIIEQNIITSSKGIQLTIIENNLNIFSTTVMENRFQITYKYRPVLVY